MCTERAKIAGCEVRLPRVEEIPSTFVGFMLAVCYGVFLFSSRRRHTRFDCDWSSDVCSSDLLPPPRPRCHELLVKQAADRLHVTCIPARLSILTRPLNGRAACHYCGQCNRGCRVNANFTSTNVLIAPALATGKLTLLTNAMAREVVMDATGRATGVAYVDKATGADRRVRAKVVVLAASAL